MPDRLLRAQAVQGTKHGQPPAEDTDLALSLRCVSCGTLRAFVVNINLAALQARQTTAFGVEAICSVCGRKIGATVAWANRRKGYSFHSPPALDLQAHDEIPLQKPIAREE
jgi:ribosomal protein S14